MTEVVAKSECSHRRSCLAPRRNAESNREFQRPTMTMHLPSNLRVTMTLTSDDERRKILNSWQANLGANSMTVCRESNCIGKLLWTGP